MSIPRLMLAGVLVAVLAGCGGQGKADVCSDKNGELTNATFVFVQAPVSGQRVSSGFDVAGCSSTFEGTVVWSLLAKDGRTLAKGAAQGGSQEPGPYEFTVDYAVPAQEIGRLLVSAPRVTNEGFPLVKNVIPLVLGT